MPQVLMAICPWEQQHGNAYAHSAAAAATRMLLGRKVVFSTIGVVSTDQYFHHDGFVGMIGPPVGELSAIWHGA